MKPSLNMFSAACIPGLLALVTACTGKPTQVTFLDRVMTVAEFTAQPVVREKVLAFCANDPGTLRSDPNCTNAAQSVRASSSGDGNFPRFDTSLPPSLKK